MKAPLAALFSLWKDDATLLAMLGSDDSGDPSIYPEILDEVEQASLFPMICSNGLSGLDRNGAETGDAEVTCYVSVLVTDADPDAKVHAIEQRLVDLALTTTRGAVAFEGARISVRFGGGRDSNVPGRLRRRIIWAVGVN